MSRNIKRALSFILGIIFLICGSNIAYALSDETVLYNFEYPEECPNQNFFNYPDLKASAGPNVEAIEAVVDIDTFREHLVNNFASCPNYVDIAAFKIPNTPENQDAIRSYIWYETPELFQVKGLGIGTSGDYITAVYASYYYTATEYATMLKDFYKGAETLLKGIKDNSNLSDVEKALLLHDRLAVWCEYDYANYLAGSIPRESYNAYGALAKQTAVCMGYALAYDYLLLQAGIDSYYCRSSALNHAWNIVYINGKKYHVDVTWDDPVYDRSGRVNHENFLRSTAGITATGHDTTDYDATPTDTTFDSYYWQKSNAAFQLVDNDIYYIDNSAATLNKLANGVTTTCRSVNAAWKTGANSYWGGNYSRLAYDGQNLLFSLPDAIYEYNVATGDSTKMFTPSSPSGSYFSIFGFKFDDCKIICEFLNTPNYNENTKKDYTVSQPHHITDWVVTKAPTPTTTGIKQQICINCGESSGTTPIPAIAVTAKTNSVIDYTNSLVFTNTFTCNDISKLVDTSGTTTVAAEADTLYGSGTIITVYVNGEAVHTLTVIVNGDINGDSVCDVLDLAQAQLFSTNKKTPDAIEIYAANCGIAENIDETTYQNLVNKALGRIMI